MARPGFRRQLSVLLDRNLAVLFGSPGTLALLLVQPPLVGAVLGLAWQGQEGTAATYLCMAIAAVYIGCMNAAGAIVRERAIFQRERMFLLSIPAYVLSKALVLLVVVQLQMVLLLAAQGRLMHLPPGALNHVLLLLCLGATAGAATGLGLLISAVARTSYAAVVSVPVLIIPQIVFSEVVLGGVGIDKAVPSVVEKVTLTKWGYEALQVVARDGSPWTYLGSLALLAGMLAGLLSLAALKLKMDDR